MTTLAIFVERVLRRVRGGGHPRSDDPYLMEEIKRAVVAGCSKQLFLASIGTNYNLDGGGIPDGAMVATYTDLPVIRGDGDYSRVMMPAQPMQLPERVGVFAVYPSGKPREAFMFVPPAVINTWNDVGLLNPINEIMFTAEQRHIEVFHDLVGAGVSTVDMKLCIMDIALMEAYDPLPISPDMEGAVMAEVLQLYGISNGDKEAPPEKGA